MNEPENIFVDGNPYGYLLNISHPRIRELYWRFKDWKGIPRNMPMSDAERLEFEMLALGKEKHA